MDWPEIRTAAEPMLVQLHEEAVRTSILLFAFLACVILFAFVFLRRFPSRSPFRWIVALTVLAGFILIRAGGLRRPDIVVLVGTTHKIEMDETSGRWFVHLKQVRQYVLRDDVEPAVSRKEYVALPGLEQLARELQPGAEQTLLLVHGQAVGLRKDGRTKIFLPLQTQHQK
jgi:hypothetical protein